MINVTIPQIEPELKPRITVFGVGGAGGNAVNNMIKSNLEGVDFVVGNTDAQALKGSLCEKRIQLGTGTTRGLGAGSKPDVGRASAEEQIDEIVQYLEGSNMVFITAGMGGGTGTGAAPVIARAARERGILTVGVVTKPFHFEGGHRMRLAEGGIAELQQYVDTLIIIPNQNLFRIANEKTTFADAFKMADDVLHSGVRGVTDLMVMPGLINLDFADIRSVMTEMGKAMMGTGEAGGERRAIEAAEAAISNPLLDDVSMKGARGVLINITGGYDMTLFEVDEAANRVRDEVDPDANIIFGSTFDSSLDGVMRVSVVATGIDAAAMSNPRTLHPVNLSLVGDRAKKPAAPGNLTGAPAPAAAQGSAIPSAAAGLRTPQPVTAGAAAIQHDPAQQYGQQPVEAPKPAAGPLHGENQGGHFFAPKPADAGPRQPVTVGAAPLSTPQQPAHQQHAPQAPQMQSHQQPQHQPQQPAPMAPQHHHAAPQGHQQHPGQQHPGGLSVGPAPAPAPEPAPARKGNFLFGLVTGLGRKSEPAPQPVQQQPAPQAYQPQPAPQQYQPAPQGYPQQQPAYPQQPPQAPHQGYPAGQQYPAAPQQQPVYPPQQSAPQHAPGYPATPQAQAPAPRADGKPAEQEELDIPAFLRRQAN
ncbi:cell division protein FtsZ [Azospirillum melinis]|uniref:Cell division protein FtsZ n=1 Tax=Azospirillum melinis TaxID=328839 RepID=A0ABX2K5P9_9PROT|nr:cell division protein FtsZ [Azospirillum melinis]MBP2304734.1 cell division protein FtsZ [Azospirillum melinis]NUA98876.1 cell division protein FtsZ [Azospirillum melinis]